MTALSSLLALALAAAPRPPSGDAPAVPAGSQLSPLGGDEAVSPWRLALTTGVAGRFGGREISTGKDNPAVLLDFGGQADASWAEGHGQAARLRFRLFTGGEPGSSIYVPSDGEVEVGYMIGHRELRFVLFRAEAARYPGLGLQALAQVGTLPCFEGTISLAASSMELSYFVSPVEAAFVRYVGGAHLTHLPGWTTEDDRPSAASAGRLRYTLFLPSDVALSVQADLAKLWARADMLVGVEGTLGYQLPRQSAAFHAGVRWTSYTRRGLVKDTSVTDAELMVVAAASLGF